MQANETTGNRNAKQLLKLCGHMLGAEFAELPKEVFHQQLVRVTQLRDDLRSDGDEIYASIVAGFIDGMMRKPPSV